MKKNKYWILLIFVSTITFCYLLVKKNNLGEKPAEVKPPVSAASRLKTLEITSAFFTDLENPDPGMWLGERSMEQKKSGSFSNKLSNKTEYGITFFKKNTEIPEYKKIKQVKVSFQLFSVKPLKNASYVYGVSGAKGNMYEYFRETLEADPGKWSHNELILDVNPNLWVDDAVLKIYPWNPGKEDFFIDDINIELLSEGESQTAISLGPKQNFFFNYEPSNDLPQASNLSKEVAHSGNYSMELHGSGDYSAAIIKKIPEISSDTIKFISTGVWLYPKLDNPNVVMVVSVERPDGTSVSWQGKETDKMNLKKNEWHKVNFRADLRGLKISPDDVAKIYLWNKKAGTVYADDLEIVFGDLPKPGGSTSGIIMNIYGDPLSQQGKNTAPFAQSFLSPATQFTPVSNFLIDGEGNKGGEMNPANLTLSGNFLGHHNSQDDLFIADHSNWSLYSWCDEKKFIQNFSSNALSPTIGKVVLTGFFENTIQEEILLIDTGSKIRIQTIRFNTNRENRCDNKTKDVIKMVSSANEISGVDFQKSSLQFAAGNFTGDGKEELILFSAKGSWKLIEWNGGVTGIISDGSISRGTILSIHRVAFGSSHEKLLIFYEKNKKLDYCLLDFSKEKNSCSVLELKDKSFLKYYCTNSGFFSGSFEKAAPEDLYYQNREWRFDLKKVSLTADGIFIESQIDFEQPVGKMNPRFYEFTNLVNGKFFSSGADYFLIQMRNCKDADFDGKFCNEFEEINGMPSGYLFYHYKTAD